MRHIDDSMLRLAQYIFTHGNNIHWWGFITVAVSVLNYVQRPYFESITLPYDSILVDCLTTSTLIVN